MPHDMMIETPPAIGELAVNELYSRRESRPKNLPRGRPFAPGQSGNPAGRPLGALNLATRFAASLGEQPLPAEPLAAAAIATARNGDTRMLKACIDHLLPRRASSFVDIELPPLRTAEDALAGMIEVIEAAAAGDIDLDNAGRLMRLLQRFLRVSQKVADRQRKNGITPNLSTASP